jgi:tripartite-type tricarboxylate transporter receptor subunit TctC
MKTIIAGWIASILVAATAAYAQTAPTSSTLKYPTRAVRVIVPYATGGPTDTVARLIAQALSASLGQQFYVENHPGAGANIGTGKAANAPADGYTILFVTNDFAANPALSSKVPYDPINSFVPLTVVATTPEVIVVHPSVSANSVSELITLVKANPGKYHFASPGAGTTTHLAAERLFRLSNGLDLVHVPFNGGAPAITSTIAGHTLIAFTALPAAAPYIQDGMLRALAVTSSSRSPAFPDVPTLAEAGFPNHDSDLMIGVVVAAGTPRSILDILNRQIAASVALPDVKARFAALGFEPAVSTSKEFAARITADLAKWTQVAREANITRD